MNYEPVILADRTTSNVVSEIRRITRSTRMKGGGNMVASALKAMNMDKFTGGVCRDDKAIYLYAFSNDPLDVTITGIMTYPGRFLRYDRVRDTIVARAALLLETGVVMIFDQLIQKVVVRSVSEIDVMNNLVSRTRGEFELVFDSIVESNQVEITPAEASSWMVRAYHNYRRSTDILSSFEKTVKYIRNEDGEEEEKFAVWSLYLSIAEYYSRSSVTPHMQWWNVTTAEKLLRNPADEVLKAREFLKLAGESDETSLNSDITKTRPVTA